MAVQNQLTRCGRRNVNAFPSPEHNKEAVLAAIPSSAGTPCTRVQNPMTQAIAAKFAILRPLLDERARRLWAAVEARAIGRGGIIRVAEATGLSRATIRAGLQELALPGHCTGPQATPERLRRPGGGRKPLRHA